MIPTIPKEKQEEYARLVHSVQCGVQMMLDKSDSTTPKHLRTGVNIAMCEHGALISVLLKRGIITADEYADAMIEMLKKEVERYKDDIRKAYGYAPDAKITLV